MEYGELDDESIYNEEVRDELLDRDALAASEVGFMVGYDEAYDGEEGVV